MNITLTINSNKHEIDCAPSETLFSAVRRLGYYGVKFGDEGGLSGADTVLLDGKPVNAGSLFAAQAEGHLIVTIEALGEHPQQGWKKTEGLHPLQQAFVESGAIQCGYCTPGQILAAKALLEKNPNPSEDEVREAIAGVLCRCTGYLKPVQAVLKAAAVMRGDEPFRLDTVNWDFGAPRTDSPSGFDSPQLTGVLTRPKVVVTPESQTWQTVGKPEKKVDAEKLVQGKPAFAADMDMRGMLHAKVLHSPHAHARIKKIDVSKAKELKGVAAVLTWQDIPRVVYSTAGQSDPIPGPLDTFSLDQKVRFVGDRVAFVAAETAEIAEQALSLIDVEYEILDSILDSREAMKPDAVRIHDEPEYVNFADSNPEKNLAAHIRIDIGDVEKGFKEADEIFEAEYEVPKVQQVSIEPHVAVTYWDEDDRLVIRTSTQVPFHVRRMLAPVLNLPVKRIRVVKPRIGGGFGGKQEVLMEDVPAHLTIATKRPVIYEYTREEEFIAARSRHPMRVKMKTGVKRDGTITANAMYALSDTGAYGCHALTVTGNTGHKAMALYVGDGEYRKSPNIQFYADVVYTNTPPAGAFRGYGVPQGYWPVERHMEKIARALNLDPIDFRLKNAIRPGEYHPFSTAWNEGREPRPEIIQTVGLETCVAQGRAAIAWDDKYGNEEWRKNVSSSKSQVSSSEPETWNLKPGTSAKRKGIGIAMVMQGTAIPYLDMGGASIKMNDDGSFNMLVGATDLGTGSDTVLAQMAAEVLGVPLEDMICYSSDTDFTPFDKGAYASSTTYISGAAAVKAANVVAERIKARAVDMFKVEGLNVQPSDLQLSNRMVVAPNGKTIPLSEIALDSLHRNNQEQIMGVASYVSPVSPPPFAAQFAEVTVDTETGAVTVDKLVMAVDSGVIVNPLTASGQIEGGMTQALGYAVCEEMRYDDKGNAIERDLDRYHIFRADEMPELETIFVETFEPSHPFGVKAVAEIPMDGVAPAVGNAILDAIGVNVDEIPATPERVWKVVKAKEQ
ncbi:MAG: xanthine dehydrogenase [Anaerolineae bacterium]|nr:MAG: xanthine dehydrogenase [Anaerolineae bacterium]WKZ45487.1 MAG: molybdopterin-dependent oxidoreductase [Anaerolineales bacterium]